VAVELTAHDLGDASTVPGLLDQIESEVSSMTGDGAYDGQNVHDAVAARHPGAAVIIPPPSTAVASETAATQRDQQLVIITKRGRIGWHRSSGRSRRSLVETPMHRYKTIIGRCLHARIPSNQRTDAKVACNVLNRMMRLGMTRPGFAGGPNS
jgi:hypothetical protein